jgi:hypothetical protein
MKSWRNIARFARWAAAGVVLLTGTLVGEDKLPDGKRVVIVVDGALPPPSALALGDLDRAMKQHMIAPQRASSIPDGVVATLIVGVAGLSAGVDRILREERIVLPPEPESLCIRRIGGGQRVLIAGRDARGLSYALREAAHAIELAPAGSDALASVTDAIESPFLRTRSMTMHLFNRDLEAAWYGDPEFWESYLAMLAGCRFNSFTLTFTDQTNYLNPPYAHLAAVPDFPQVRVEGLDDAGRRKNLEMLRRIAEQTRARGLSFTLGIWTHLPVAKYIGGTPVHGLADGTAAADYCAAGLREILISCPAIDGIQFRMNAEAGVAEDRQTEFYRPLFKAIRDCVRPVRVDLRYKGLRPETTREAVALGLDVTVSTKFWTEHLGLPHHPTAVDSHYRADRYSFGSMLEKPRAYRVTYQLWSVGSQRLLLWGDPAYAAQFARNCRLGEGEGFEVFAPLSDKGFGNAPGNWRIFADRSLEHYRWEFERYWLFYLVFGRLGYNPDASAVAWQREMQHRFGDAARDVEAAFRSAGQVLPLITAARLPSASEWFWWPEMDTGDRLAEYMRTPASDPRQFYAIRSWQRTPRWRCEVWDEDISGYVEDAIAGRLRGKWTPIQVAQRLRDLAGQTLASVGRFHAATPELRATELDLRVLAALAQYHAAKTMAATDLAFFEKTGESGRLPRALAQMKDAAASWKHIVSLTDGIYHSNLVFGYAPQHGRKGGHHHSGHWKDRLAEVREDVAHLEALVKQHSGDANPPRTFPGELPPADLPDIQHTPIATAKAGADLPVATRIVGIRPPREVLLHFRPLNQTRDWREVPMRATEDGEFEATIPGTEISAQWDLQYYIEVLTDTGGRLWPSWENGTPYVVVSVR